jgi:hypothetical protein
MIERPAEKLPSLRALQDSVEIDFAGYELKWDYICLSSAEYDQFYLPREFACYQCDKTKRARDLVSKGWSPTDIMIVIRRGNIIDAFQVKAVVPPGHKESIYTSYKGASYHPEKRRPFKQCSTAPRPQAYCMNYIGQCLLMFNDSQTHGSVKG